MNTNASSHTQHTALGLCAVAAMFAAAMACVDDPSATTPEATQAHEQPIVGGEPEPGHPAVGALTSRILGFGYIGSFCTGTLIAPDWVLTAAHCLTPTPPGLMRFYIGTDARPTDSRAQPSEGDFYSVQRVIIHPDYDVTNDIALIQLAEPVDGVTPYAYNTDNTAAFVGAEALYVGYGVDDGLFETGGGLKRSTRLAITTVEATTYTNTHNGSGVCFGDSGGPGLLELDDQLRIIGVNAAVQDSGEGDPCGNGSIITRVDAYADWITEQINAPAPDCRQNADVCLCAEACTDDGTCDRSACPALSCEAAYGCVYDCAPEDTACTDRCYASSTDAGREQLDAVLVCLSTYCNDVPDDQFQDCINANCGAEVDGCFPPATGTENCETTDACMRACGQDTACQDACFGQGSAQAQEHITALYTCLNTECGDITDEDAWLECATTRCSDAIDACFPPDDCPITGGGCAEGTACYVTSTNATSCYASDGLGLDQPCDPNFVDTLPCADGLICVEYDDGGFCTPFCLSDQDCVSGLSCEIPIFTNNNDIGICVPGCTDADQDGACAEVDDCDDNDPNANPSASEVCGDGVDNDCDAQIDEQCDDTPNNGTNNATNNATSTNSGTTSTNNATNANNGTTGGDTNTSGDDTPAPSTSDDDGCAVASPANALSKRPVSWAVFGLVVLGLMTRRRRKRAAL